MIELNLDPAPREEEPEKSSPQVVDGPSDPQAEEGLIGACMVDPDVLTRCVDLPPTHFTDSRRQVVFACMMSMRRRAVPVECATVLETLRAEKRLKAAGGQDYVINLGGIAPSTALATLHLETVRNKAALRSIVALSRRAMEDAEGANGDAGDLVERFKREVAQIGPSEQPILHPHVLRPLFSIPLVPPGHQSILLGNRYLNRGDGAVIVSSSGMGKSAMCLQMATELALNIGPFGIQGNGPLRSLIVQSEDGDGDLAEVTHSIRHVMKLTPEQIRLAEERVIVATDGSNRGPRFLQSLKASIAATKPDLVWLNPLQAFMAGDVTDGQDLSEFLREGLNGLNTEKKFGYIIVHHTTKPATGKERTERLWHEVMYDMAGGAEIINWARAILSLRPTPTEGNFNLVLAKRGRRAGVTKEVPHGIGVRLEPVTTIPLRHAKGFFPTPHGDLPAIFWEGRPEDAAEPEKKAGRPEKYTFADYRNIFPAHTSAGLPIAQLQKLLNPNKPIQVPTLHNCLRRWAEQGFVEIIEQVGRPMQYRAVFGPTGSD